LNIKSFLSEYNHELDDVRWYLAMVQADRMLEYRDDRSGLCRLIWSGKLEAELYNMEELFLAELQEKLDSRKTDEAEIRKIMGEIDAAKMSR
jgi:hypothetical protein